MHTTPQMSCRGHECTVQRVLPFAGAALALIAMLVPMAIYIVPSMFG